MEETVEKRIKTRELYRKSLENQGFFLKNNAEDGT